MAWAFRQNPDSVAYHSGVLEYELKLQKKNVIQQDFLVERVRMWQTYSQATLAPLAVWIAFYCSSRYLSYVLRLSEEPLEIY